LENIRKYGFP